MGMELRGGVTIDGPGRIVLELCGDELSRCLCRMVAADARLCVMFQLLQRDTNAFPVGHTHTIISADKRGKRNRFGSGKGGVPTGTVLHRLDCFSVRIFVFMCCPMVDELLFRLRMLPLTQSCEFFSAYRASQSILFGQTPLPLPLDSIALRSSSSGPSP